MLMLAISYVPSAERLRDAASVLCIVSAALFGGALCAAVIVPLALRQRRIRARAVDPYATSFGDYPNTRTMLGPRE